MRNRREGKIVVGLTGNIGSGKSTALELFAKDGVMTISSDEIAHSILEIDEEAREAVKVEFGDAIIDDEGAIDRAKLASIVFKNEAKRKALEAILHPRIMKVIDDEVNGVPEGSIIVVEIPLLFEAQLTKRFTHTVLIHCPVETRKKRYCHAKGISEEDFDCREATQWSEDKKAEYSMYFINNSGTLAELETQIKAIIEILKKNL